MSEITDEVKGRVVKKAKDAWDILALCSTSRDISLLASEAP